MATHRRHVVRTNPDYDEDRLEIPGWSVGWNDEISAHAAVRGTRGKLFVMTSLEHDSAPKSLDDEVAVGIYKLEGDEWEMVDQADFDSVSEVLAMSMSELERAIMDGAGGSVRESKILPPRRSNARLAKFWFDGGPEVVGWSFGETWNGYGIPYFAPEQLAAAFAALKDAGMTAKRKGDVIVITGDEWVDEYDSFITGELKLWKLDGLTWNEKPLRRRPR